jgi:hypothetical protein
MNLSSTTNSQQRTDSAVSAYPLRKKITTVQIIVRSVKQFFGIQVKGPYYGSRIIRRKAKSFDEFIFKGYDQQTPGLFRPGSFKELKKLYKN